MTTKARRTKPRRYRLARKLVQLGAQARLNAGDSASRGHSSEADEWSRVARFLEGWASYVVTFGTLPAQPTLFEDAELPLV